MQALFEVLADETRRRILELLREGERPVGKLVAELGMSQPAVSRHLRVLREAGLVRVRVAAQRRLYRLRLVPLRDLDAWLAPYRLLWTWGLEPAGSAGEPPAPDDVVDPEAG